jgi:hypothetical protein
MLLSSPLLKYPVFEEEDAVNAPGEPEVISPDKFVPEEELVPFHWYWSFALYMKISRGTNVAFAKPTVEPKFVLRLFSTTLLTTRESVRDWLLVLEAVKEEDSVVDANMGSAVKVWLLATVLLLFDKPSALVV